MHPNLQEDAIQNTMRSEKMLWVILFFVFTKILFPIIRHSIKHRWIFALLGLVVSAIIHLLLAENIANFNNATAIPIYAILIPLGIYATIRMRQRAYMKANRYGSPTNPHAPSELYDDDDYYDDYEDYDDEEYR